MIRFILRSIFLVFIFSYVSCMHQPSVIDKGASASYITVTPSCKGCATDPICPVVDDIPANNGTQYLVCNPIPAGKGSYVLNSAQCLIWTPVNDANEIVNTCIIACNGIACDTTFIQINPPLPDDGSGSGIPCNADTVYFERDILPLITSSCAYAGCHNAASKKDGVILDNYTNIIKTGKVKAFNPGDSELFEVITETDPKDVMPPPPASKLTSTQIALIEKWIRQGAKNNRCDEDGSACNTNNVSYTNYVKPAIASCVTCHKTGNASGGVTLDTYASTKAAALNGKLHGSISWSPGFKAMPQGGSKLPDCTIKKIKSWVDAGAPEN